MYFNHWQERLFFNKYKQMPSLAFGNFNVRKKKKKDDLLINVLPAEAPYLE